MFDKISKNKYKRIIAWKYFFQFVFPPLCFSLILVIIELVFGAVTQDLEESIDWLFSKSEVLGIKIHGIVTFILFGCIINLPNILSVIPFIKLLFDCFSRNDEETKVIDFVRIMPMYELQCIRQSKRFMWDTFSRKQNEEMFIYDENNKKYRFFWNENYGDPEKKYAMADAPKLKISYFKRSRIVFKCQPIYDNPFAEITSEN